MTAKQIAGYLKAAKEPFGISFNDAYNVPTYGITKAEYDAINRAMYEAYGLFPERTPAGVKEALRKFPISAKGAAVHHATRKSAGYPDVPMKRERCCFYKGRHRCEFAADDQGLCSTHLYTEKGIVPPELKGVLPEPGTRELRELHHATKKSPAQLQREIDEALAGKGTSRGRQHSSISDSDKIRNAIARFPSTFGLRGFPGGVFRISPTSSYVSGERVMLYTERKDNGAWLDFSKGTESELRSEVTSLASTGSRSHSTKSKKRPSQGSVVGRHGLGTADVRTGDGAYWIVTVPTGYRVDYKPWGPSNEVDLGTFPSRQRALAKINEHIGGTGAVRSHATKKRSRSSHAKMTASPKRSSKAQIFSLGTRVRLTGGDNDEAIGLEGTIVDAPTRTWDRPAAWRRGGTWVEWDELADPSWEKLEWLTPVKE
jgi:hypothetical protein